MSRSTTSLAGWLFADFLLVFALVMTGTRLPEPERGPHGPTASPSATPSPTPSPVPSPTARPPGLSRDPVTVTVTLETAAVLRHDESAVRALRAALRKKRLLEGRRAGMVLTFGAQSSGGALYAKAVNALLSRVDEELFGDVTTCDFHNLRAANGWVELDIYLFQDT